MPKPDLPPKSVTAPAPSGFDMFADDDIPEEVLAQSATIATMDASNLSMKGKS
jgi:hypothetical protein